MNAQPDRADLAAMRAEGDLLPYLISLTGRTPTKPKSAKAERAAPSYHIPRPGAWPCGTAPSGPTPQPCDECKPPAA
ncbi:MULTISPECIES: hypothetical protein [unclassified Streptomyces]|uniref:hypothetical protein n=1 Tax=unclassified Streptomyces TaxID=2593676 RepID=UPI00148895D9|nr:MULTISPECIES: hypothetical protein [unclassified Streptomyces]